MIAFHSVPAVVVIGATIVAAITDIRNYKVRNVLTLPLLVSGLCYRAIVGGWAGLADSSLGLGFGFGVLLLFYAVGGMGAGDVKLMAAIGAWLGMPLTFYVFIASALACGVYSVCLLVWTKGYEDALLQIQIMLLRMKVFGRHLALDTRIEQEVRRDDRRKRLIPFASTVAVGVALTYLWASYVRA